MNPERFAMLAPKGVDVFAVRGGLSEVTPEDIAAAMHELDPLEWELLTVKYCGGKPHKLYAHVMLELKNDQMSQQVIVHTVGHNNCPKCQGVKELLIGERKITCERCGGSGKYYHGPSNAEIDRAVRWLQQVEAVALGKVQG